MSKRLPETTATTNKQATMAALYTRCAHVLDLMRVLNKRYGTQTRNEEAARALNRCLTYAILHATEITQKSRKSGFLCVGDEITLPDTNGRATDPLKCLCGQISGEGGRAKTQTSAARRCEYVIAHTSARK